MLDCDQVLRRLFIAAIVVIALVVPIVEAFDSWDHTLQDGNDTEANVVVAALCVGVAFAIGTILVTTRIRARASSPAGRVIATRVLIHRIVSRLAPVPTSSPPTVLRV